MTQLQADVFDPPNWPAAMGDGSNQPGLAIPTEPGHLLERLTGLRERPKPVGRPTFDEAYYRANYRNYDRQNPAGKLAFYRSLVDDVPRPAQTGRPRRILDIGCAFGGFLSTLDESWERSGFDASAFAIARAVEALPKARLDLGNLPDIPFEGPFDAVTAFDVLEHVRNLRAARRAIRDRLAPGGRFVFGVPVYDGLSGPIVHLLDRDPTHVHKRSRDFWLEWASEAFHVVDWVGVVRFLFPAVHYYLHRPTRSLRRHAPAIVVLAENVAA